MIPDGELVFASDRIGHRLRDGESIDVPRDRWEDVPVVIVGGGAAGLTAAWRFESAGFGSYALLELDPVAGGTAKSGSGPNGAHPWGAHYVTTPMAHNAMFIRLLREMGVVLGVDREGEPVIGEPHLCREPQERLFIDGQWQEGLFALEGASEADLRDWSRFRAIIDRYAAARDAKGRRAFAIPVEASSDDATFTALDRIAMSTWLDQQNILSPRVRWLVDYACRDDFGARAAQTSAWAGIHYFAARMRTAGSEPQSVITWPEGNGRIIRHLYERTKSKVRLDAAALELVPQDGHVEVRGLRGGREAFGIRARRVIVAAPQFVVRALVRPYRDAPPSYSSAFEHGAWMVANLHLRARPKGKMLAWDNVFYDSPSLGYVVSTHQAYADHGPTTWTYYYPLCDEDPRAARRRLFTTGRETWADVALSDIEPAHPEIRALTIRLDVIRWGHAMVRPRPGFLFGTARAQAQEPFRNVHVAAADLGGIGIFEEAFFHGVRAADEVLRAEGRTAG